MYEAIANRPNSPMIGRDGCAAYIVRPIVSEGGNRGVVLCEYGDVWTTHPDLQSSSVVSDIIQDMGLRLNDCGYQNLVPRPRTSKS